MSCELAGERGYEWLNALTLNWKLKTGGNRLILSRLLAYRPVSWSRRVVAGTLTEAEFFPHFAQLYSLAASFSAFVYLDVRQFSR